jgi:hypothetical protein
MRMQIDHHSATNWPSAFEICRSQRAYSCTFSTPVYRGWTNALLRSFVLYLFVMVSSLCGPARTQTEFRFGYPLAVNAEIPVVMEMVGLGQQHDLSITLEVLGKSPPTVSRGDGFALKGRLPEP